MEGHFGPPVLHVSKSFEEREVALYSIVYPKTIRPFFRRGTT